MRAESKGKVQLDHVLLDVSFFDKPKIKALDFKFGPIASALLIRVLCDISRATNAEIDKDVINALAYQLRFERADEWLEYCVKNNILTILDSGAVTNERVAEDQEAMHEKRVRWNERQDRSRGVTRLSRVCHASVTRDNSVTLNTEDLNTEVLNTEDPGICISGGSKGDTGNPDTPNPHERAPGVVIDDIQWDTGLLEYFRYGLDAEWAQRGCLHVSRHLQKPGKEGVNPFTAWITWALRECLNDQKAALDADSAKTRNNRAKTQIITSEARAGPNKTNTDRTLNAVAEIIESQGRFKK